MARTLLTALFLILLSVPASAKSNDIYPVSCNDLWTAVKDALSNRSDYGIVSMNDAQLKASFVVVGSLTVFTNHVALTATGGGCAMKATITEIGADNPDWRRFHKRVRQSLARQQAILPAQSTKPPGQM